MICKVCGSENDISAKECVVCGTPLAMESEERQSVKTTKKYNIQVENFLKRAEMSLKDGNYNDAWSFSEKALDLDAECDKAYFLKVLCKMNISIVDMKTLEEDADYKKAEMFASEELEEKLNDLRITIKRQSKFETIFADLIWKKIGITRPIEIKTKNNDGLAHIYNIHNNSTNIKKDDVIAILSKDERRVIKCGIEKIYKKYGKGKDEHYVEDLELSRENYGMVGFDPDLYPTNCFAEKGWLDVYLYEYVGYDSFFSDPSLLDKTYIGDSLKNIIYVLDKSNPEKIMLGIGTNLQENIKVGDKITIFGFNDKKSIEVVVSKLQKGLIFKKNPEIMYKGDKGLIIFEGDVDFPMMEKCILLK